MAIPADDVEFAPALFSNAKAAALPVAGLTAWRALIIKSTNAEACRNILVTGIGGGVTIMVLSEPWLKGATFL